MKIRRPYVVMNTIKIDNSYLTVRHIEGANPIRVIPCSNADLPLDSNVLKGDAPTIIAVSEAAKEENVEHIRSMGVEVWICGERKVDLVLLLEKLFERGVKRLMLEGGPTLAWEMIKLLEAGIHQRSLGAKVLVS